MRIAAKMSSSLPFRMNCAIPLAAMNSAAMLLESRELDSAEREWTIQVVRRQCRTMKILLDDLLDVTRFTLGRVTLKKQTLTLASVIRIPRSKRHNPHG